VSFRATLAGAGTLLLGEALLLACGSRTIASRPVGSEFIEVDYPPPPARIEEIPEQLAGRPDCRWMDGFFSWQGRRWEWNPGRWVVAPAGCERAPGALNWSRQDPPRLYYTPPYWYAADASGTLSQRPCAAPIPCQTPPPNPSSIP
jgi:hypothetical protein